MIYLHVLKSWQSQLNLVHGTTNRWISKKNQKPDCSEEMVCGGSPEGRSESTEEGLVTQVGFKPGVKVRCGWGSDESTDQQVIGTEMGQLGIGKLVQTTTTLWQKSETQSCNNTASKTLTKYIWSYVNNVGKKTVPTLFSQYLVHQQFC